MFLLAAHLCTKLRKPNFCQFHTSASRQALPLIIKYAIKIFGKGAAIIIGRKLRFQRPLAQKMSFSEWISCYKRSLIVGSTIIGLGGIFYWTHQEYTPITGRRRFMMFSPSQYEYFYDLMHEANKQALKDVIMPVSSGYHLKVSQVLNKLLKANADVEPSLSKIQWCVHALDGSAKDYAFSLPRGDIYVNKLVIDLCENDDELAGVIGHEMAHVILQHHNEMVSQVILKDSFLVLLIVAIWTYLTSDFSATLVHIIVNKLTQIITTLPFQRQYEIEADQVSLQLCTKACYDIRHMSAFFHKVKLFHKPQNPALFNTHPSLESRITLLDELIPKALQQRLSCGCHNLPDTDPRLKYIQDTPTSRNL